MLISDIYNLLGNFVVRALDVDGLTIIFANQTSTRPTKPFITIAISTIRQENLGVYSEIHENGLQDIHLTKRFTASFQAFTDELHQAESLLNLLENKFATSLAEEVFNSSVVYQQTLMGVSSAPEAESFENEQRAILDVEFSTSQAIEDNIGFIEHIQAGININ